MPLISLAGVGKLFGADRVLDNISLQIERGDHVGLVGSNGAGKSTLLRIIAGLTQPDSGTVSRTRALRVVYLPQEPEFHESHSLRDALLEAFRPALDAQDRLQAIEREMARAEVAPEIIEEYGRLQSVVEHAGYDYRERVERVLTGLGFMPDTWDTPVDELSGGQRTRANLGKTLLQDGDVLLLDEPSNHLDIPAMEWLETYLRDLTRAFILVAHDRYLLDRVTTRTLDLSFGKLTSYDAPYSRFLELRAARMERQRAEYQAQQQHIARTEDFIRRYGAGQRSKEARGRQKRLDRLERVEKPREHSGVHIGQMGAARSGDVVLEARDLVVGYSNKQLIRLPDEIVVLRGAHLAIVGPNGSGKTTLIRTLLGSTPPLAGEVRWGARTTRGYYSQTLEGLDLRRTLLEEVGSVRPMSEEEARGHLGRFLFTGDDVFKAVSVLSGGERSRAALAKLVLEEPNVLVLDEPTNHLDIASREALTTVLRQYPGTLLFVSHDRYLIDTLASELWIVREGELFRVAGSYSDFAAGRAKRLDAPRAGSRLTNGADSSPKVDLEVLEAQAESLTEQLSELGATMSVAQLAELTDRYADVLGALSGAEETWLETEKRRLRASSA